MVRKGLTGVPTGGHSRWSEGPDPESRDCGFRLRLPRNDTVVTNALCCSAPRMPNIAPNCLTGRQWPPKLHPAVDIPSDSIPASTAFVPDSRRAWTRLAVAVLIGALGSVGMWSVVVALPAVQTEFAASRGTASLAFTLVMLGFGSGGVLTGQITDRYGIVSAIGLGIGILCLGYIGAGLSSSIWQFILVHFAIGLGSSATFGPLMAEASHWFNRYRGLAVTIAASGNYLGGTIWPPLVNWGMQTYGWRTTH